MVTKKQCMKIMLVPHENFKKSIFLVIYVIILHPYKEARKGFCSAPVEVQFVSQCGIYQSFSRWKNITIIYDNLGCNSQKIYLILIRSDFIEPCGPNDFRDKSAWQNWKDASLVKKIQCGEHMSLDIFISIPVCQSSMCPFSNHQCPPNKGFKHWLKC